MSLDDRGREVLDSRPVSIPVGYKRPESLNDMIRRLVKTGISQQASAMGRESFDEANDFDVPGDVPFQTPYEESVDNIQEGFDVDPSSVGPGLDAVRAGLADPPPAIRRPASSPPKAKAEDEGGDDAPSDPPASGGATGGKPGPASK